MRIFFHFLQFMIRQQVLKLYRDIFRTIRHIPDKSNQNEMKQWARSDFRANMHHTDENTIKMCLQQGQRSFTQLRTNLELSGLIDPSKNPAEVKPKPTTK